MAPQRASKPESTMVQAARWLHTDVGVGQVYTKNDLRVAFPGIEQIDRRIRDLRPFGWVIHTNREDSTLASNELRFVSEGQPVWDGHRLVTHVSSKDRQDALLASGYLCSNCGISAGEDFADGPYQSAVLSVSRVNNRLTVLCQRCRAGQSDSLTHDQVARAVQVFAKLEPQQRAEVLERLASGRKPSEVERAWSIARRARLSADELLASVSNLGEKDASN
jgi:hypothetical protein